MRSVEVTGRTVEDAVVEALRRLGVGRADADIEVLSEPARSLFGLFGQKEAQVRATVKLSKAEFGREFVTRVAQALDADIEMDLREADEAIHLNVRGSDLGLMIGRYGQTLNAIQYLMNVASKRTIVDDRPLRLDIEGYRKRRYEAVEQIALRTADRVARTGRGVHLDPMNAGERKVVHMTLQDHEGVVTESVGQEPYRKVMVRPRAGSGDWERGPRGTGL